MKHLPQRDRNGMAYGIDPHRKEFFSLRQARYDALAEYIARIATQYRDRGSRLKLLDIGPYEGTTFMHLQDRDGTENIDVSIAELELCENLFGKDRIKEIFIGDLTQGYPEIPDESYDVVVCEQVLEHLPELEVATKTIARVLKRGGIAIIGVPIFPYGVHLIRRHGQPIWDKVMPMAKRHRGHIQTFSKNDFIQVFKSTTNLQPKLTRGFRIVSGGPLRFLENHQWFWQLSCKLGRALPGLCTEIQVVFEKPDSN